MQISRPDLLIEESVAAGTGNATAVDPQSGTRSSLLTGYFELNATSKRKDLVALTGAEAIMVLFKVESQDKTTPRVAEAVEFVSGGNKYRVKAAVKAKTEVTVHVQLLELSRIGGRNLLKIFGIETLIDLPGVGENLLDQTYTLIYNVAKKHVKTLGWSPFAPINPRFSIAMCLPTNRRDAHKRHLCATADCVAARGCVLVLTTCADGWGRVKRGNRDRYPHL
ncbi:hypothetical protein BJV78DRAFT_1176685 [Lactifluus subvellereus]|nr:hypothetical protein BJV78DRAFT_1176685 [Lactifluus subvellereus]